jgi:5-formyltetrahydrofolate cyclo-ligase
MRSWSLALQNKPALRKKLRVLLSALDAKTYQSTAVAAARIFSESSIFAGSQNIACYASLPHEFNTQPVIETIWQANKTCYLPIVTVDITLNFSIYQQHTQLKPNAFNILEPANSAENYFPPAQLDCVLLPLIAFDLQGYRLGTGSGYYDRTFAFLKKNRRKPTLIGVGFTQQQVDEVAHDTWDVRLDGVLTSEQFILF